MGVLSLMEALKTARERGLDLVEVSPQATPPVCKITDFGAMKFRQQKLERKQKARQKKVDVKGIRISLNIGDHDRDIKAKRSAEFLEEGHKVKIEIILRGRERQFKDLAISQIDKFQSAIPIPTREESKVSFLGNRISKIITKA
jgi:translation initiation factor IF-3